MQLPLTFHNPDSAPGLAGGGLGALDNNANVSGGVSGKFWIAGGGGSSHPSAEQERWW